MEDEDGEDGYYHIMPRKTMNHPDCNSQIESHSCQTYEDHATQTEDEDDSEAEAQEDLKDEAVFPPYGKKIFFSLFYLNWIWSQMKGQVILHSIIEKIRVFFNFMLWFHSVK